jgi:hypothetical protein
MENEEKQEVTKTVVEQSQTPVTPKTFTQEQVDDMITKRLSRANRTLLDAIGIKDESELGNIVAKVKEYDSIKAEHELTKKERDELKAEKESATYKSELSTVLDASFIDYALTKIEKGANIEEFKANVAAFLKANPKMARDSFVQIDSTLPLNGTAGMPDFSKMTDAQFVEWQKTHNLDGTLKRQR